MLKRSKNAEGCVNSEILFIYISLNVLYVFCLNKNHLVLNDKHGSMHMRYMCVHMYVYMYIHTYMYVLGMRELIVFAK